MTQPHIMENINGDFTVQKLRLFTLCWPLKLWIISLLRSTRITGQQIVAKNNKAPQFTYSQTRKTNESGGQEPNVSTLTHTDTQPVTLEKQQELLRNL